MFRFDSDSDGKAAHRFIKKSRYAEINEISLKKAYMEPKI